MLSMFVNMRSLQHVYHLLQGFTTQNLFSLLWQFRRKQSKDQKLLKVLQEVLECHDFHQMQHYLHLIFMMGLVGLSSQREFGGEGGLVCGTPGALFLYASNT